MSELPKGYKVLNLPDGSESLIGPGGLELAAWCMDGTPEGYYVTASFYNTSKDELKENLAAMNAYLDGAK